MFQLKEGVFSNVTEQLKNEVENIIVHSQDFPFDVDATNLLEQWEQAKAPIIELFGGTTIIRSKKKIKVTLSSEQRSRKFNEFLFVLDDNGVLTEDFETFLRVNADGFFENKVLLPHPSYHIPQGAKILKSFKKFLPNQEVTRWAQDTASRYIQENKIEGYLYLSVDPRDFLTLSENAADWYSCQSLDGDYRAGDLSYMVDNTTIVAYLAGDEKEHFKCLPKDVDWYSKKWRMLVHLNGDKSIYYNRQYPYQSTSLLEQTHTMLTDLLGDIFTEPISYGFKIVQGQLGDSKRLVYNQINAGGRTYDTRDFINVNDYNGYSDLITSSSYTPIVAVNKDYIDGYRIFCLSQYPDKQQEEMLFNAIFSIKLGERPICPCCGQEYIKRDDKLLCDDCIAEHDADEDFFLTCHSCYRRIYDEDEVYFEGTVPYCKSCYHMMHQPNLIEEEENE